MANHPASVVSNTRIKLREGIEHRTVPATIPEGVPP